MVRFNGFEKKALIGINEGKFDVNLANELFKLKKDGVKLADIPKKVNYPDITPELIDPIIRFLLNHEADDVLESYQKYLNGVKIKHCDVCGEEFVESKKVTGQTTCKKCRKKYKPVEIMVLKGYRAGKYNQNTAIYAYSLRNMGLKNREIADELKIPSNLVPAIIDLLLPEGFAEKKDDSPNSEPKNICKYCGKEFSPKTSSNDLFCSDCNRKYDCSDLLFFIGIKEAKYSFKLATEIFKLRKNGSSYEDISEKLHIPLELINNILTHFGFYGDEINTSNNLNNCSVCGNLFVMAKGTSNQQYCPSCKEKFMSSQLRVLAGINNGIYNKKLAIKIKDLLEKGESKSFIAKKLNISIAVIDPIIEYLYEDKMPDFMNDFSINSNLSGNLLITNCSDNQTNIKLKGTISKEFAIDFMKILPKINFTIKEIFFKEKERGIEFSANFDVDDSYLDRLFSELIDIGFE